MPGNLLIIEDEPQLLKKLKILLEEFADEIYLAENGVVGLEMLANNTVHCVICDINMPRMNGVEVIKNVRQQENEVPFIFYTGHGNHELMLEAAKYGAFDFLNKPNLDGLEEVVQRGLKMGFDRTTDITLDGSNFMSEYSKLLLELEKK